MAEHLQVGELHQGGRLEVHVVGADFLAAFFDAVGDVLLLRAFVVAQASDEVVEGLLEHGGGCSGRRRRARGGELVGERPRRGVAAGGGSEETS